MEEKKSYNKLQINFQNLIKEERRMREISQVEMAKRTGFSQSSVSKYEAGEKKLDVVELTIVCKALGIKLSDFITRLEKQLKEKDK